MTFSRPSLGIKNLLIPCYLGFTFLFLLLTSPTFSSSSSLSHVPAPSSPPPPSSTNSRSLAHDTCKISSLLSTRSSSKILRSQKGKKVAATIPLQSTSARSITRKRSNNNNKDDSHDLQVDHEKSQAKEFVDPIRLRGKRYQRGRQSYEIFDNKKISITSERNIVKYLSGDSKKGKLQNGLLQVRGGESRRGILNRGRPLKSMSSVNAGIAGTSSASSVATDMSLTKEKTAEYNKLIWTIKLLFLLFYGSLGAVMPYLPVYYSSLGLNGKQIGHLGAITPAVTFLVAPLWGSLADSTSRHKDVLMFTLISSVISRLLFVKYNSFFALVVLVTVTAALNAPVRPLLDSAVLNELHDKKEYGKQRLWGQFGFGLAGAAIGPLLTKPGFGYQSAFWAHAIISIPTALLLKSFSPKKQKKESPKIKEGLSLLLKNQDALMFFFLVFIIGVSSGIIENFAYVRLREVGGEGTVMGVSRFFSSITGVPMFWYSGLITKKLSVMGVLVVSLACYIIRFFIYATIKSPWGGLPAEALRGTTFAAMWASATYYTHRISPPGMSATMLAFLNGMYGGLGQSTGALIGGALQAKHGTAKTFILSGTICTFVLAGFIGYWIAHPQATVLPDDSEASK